MISRRVVEANRPALFRLSSTCLTSLQNQSVNVSSKTRCSRGDQLKFTWIRFCRAPREDPKAMAEHNCPFFPSTKVLQTFDVDDHRTKWMRVEKRANLFAPQAIWRETLWIRPIVCKTFRSLTIFLMSYGTKGLENNCRCFTCECKKHHMLKNELQADRTACVVLLLLKKKTHWYQDKLSRESERGFPSLYGLYKCASTHAHMRAFTINRSKTCGFKWLPWQYPGQKILEICGSLILIFIGNM